MRTAPPPSRVTLVASGAFFISYLLVQTVHAALAWVRPGYDRFTWHLYAGLHERLQLSVAVAVSCPAR